MIRTESSQKNVRSEAQPFLRYATEQNVRNIMQSADSDSGSCGGDSSCGSGGASCGHVPEGLKIQP